MFDIENMLSTECLSAKYNYVDMANLLGAVEEIEFIGGDGIIGYCEINTMEDYKKTFWNESRKKECQIDKQYPLPSEESGMFFALYQAMIFKCNQYPVYGEWVEDIEEIIAVDGPEAFFTFVECPYIGYEEIAYIRQGILYGIRFWTEQQVLKLLVWDAEQDFKYGFFPHLLFG